jgi:predicted nucleic acid-binding protein
LTGIVIDASVTLSWCFPDEQEAASIIVLDRIKAFFDTLRILSPSVDQASMDRIAGPVQMICRDHGLTPYDALYVELAQRSGCPLATLDREQRRAARAPGVHCL